MVDQIRRFKYAQPFAPFDIELSSGQLIQVATPDHIAFSDVGQGRVSYSTMMGRSPLFPGCTLSGSDTSSGLSYRGADLSWEHLRTVESGKPFFSPVGKLSIA